MLKPRSNRSEGAWKYLRAPYERFAQAEGMALQLLPNQPSFLAERELVGVVHNNYCVEVEANWYSAQQTPIR